MNPSVDESDEEYLDDPIILMDFEQARIKAIRDFAENTRTQVTSSLNSVAPEQPPNKNTCKLPAAFFDISSNIWFLNNCRPLSIQLVDCDKYPWFYKKYINQIKVNMNNESMNLTENQLPKEVEEHTTHRINIRKVDCKEKLRHDEILSSQESLENNLNMLENVYRGDLEIVAVSKKNVPKIDFKRNIGLIGLKVTPRFGVIEDFPTNESKDVSSLFIKNKYDDTKTIESYKQSNYLLGIDKALSRVGTTIVPIFNKQNKEHVNRKTNIDYETKCEINNIALELSAYSIITENNPVNTSNSKTAPNMVIKKNKSSKSCANKTVGKYPITFKTCDNMNKNERHKNKKVTKSDLLIESSDKKKHNVKCITKTNKYQNSLNKNKQDQSSDASKINTEGDDIKNKLSGFMGSGKEFHRKESYSDDGTKITDFNLSNYMMGSKSPVFPCNVNVLNKSFTKYNSDGTGTTKLNTFDETMSNRMKMNVTHGVKEQDPKKHPQSNYLISKELSGPQHCKNIPNSIKTDSKQSTAIAFLDENCITRNNKDSKIQSAPPPPSIAISVSSPRANIKEQQMQNLRKKVSANLDTTFRATEVNNIFAGTETVSKHVSPNKRVKKIKEQLSPIPSHITSQPDLQRSNVGANKSCVTAKDDIFGSTRSCSLKYVPITPTPAAHGPKKIFCLPNVKNYPHVIENSSLVGTDNHYVLCPQRVQAPPPPPPPPLSTLSPPPPPPPPPPTTQPLNKLIDQNLKMNSKPSHQLTAVHNFIRTLHYINKQPHVLGSPNTNPQATLNNEKTQNDIELQKKITDLGQDLASVLPDHKTPTFNISNISVNKQGNIQINSEKNPTSINLNNCKIIPVNKKIATVSQIDVIKISKDAHGLTTYSIKNSPNGGGLNRDPQNLLGMQVPTINHKHSVSKLSYPSTTKTLITSDKKNVTKPITKGKSNKGYSPSILPIPPTYQKNLSFSSPISLDLYNSASNNNEINNKTVFVQRGNGRPILNESSFKTSSKKDYNTRKEENSKPSKKISLEEYKNRASVGNSNTDIADKRPCKRLRFNTNMDKKINKGSHSSDQDLGYDSDCTVTL